METLLVGIDGACLPVLDRLTERGVCPSIEALREEGVSGPLESGIPPWTPSAWPSLYTGTNPGKHGVFGFLSFSGYDWGVVDATHVDARPVWEHLAVHDIGSVVVNVPVTHPPRAFPGVLVPGYTAPDDPDCHPEGTLAELRAELGEYRLYPSHTGSDGVPMEAKLEEYRALTSMRGAAFRYLVDRADPEFGFVQFQQPDTVVHECAGAFDAIAAVYEAVDEEVGAILDHCDPARVILASDHGVGPYDGWTVRLNEHLRREGFVETVRGGGEMPSWDALRDRELRERADGSGSSLLTTLSTVAARAGLTSQRLEPVLRRLGLSEFVLRHVPRDAVRAGTERVDFPASSAYVRSRIELGVRINLQGREPDGVVPPGAYDAVRRALIESLRSLRTPDGTPVFETVAPRETFFEGPHVEDAVDIVTIPHSFDQFLSTQLRGDLFDAPEEPWNHKRHGVVVAAGAGIDETASPTGAHIHDVAPTVLATFGLARDDRMDGTVLPFVESCGATAYPAYDPDERRTTDREAVERRLRALGYIEG
jgi:predicted AlkP superfamily phosphohydrolase/phosphomutase